MWADGRFLSHSTLQIVQHSGNTKIGKKKLKWIIEIVVLFDNIVCQPLVTFPDPNTTYCLFGLIGQKMEFGVNLEKLLFGKLVLHYLSSRTSRRIFSLSA